MSQSDFSSDTELLSSSHSNKDTLSTYSNYRKHHHVPQSISHQAQVKWAPANWTVCVALVFLQLVTVTWHYWIKVYSTIRQHLFFFAFTHCGYSCSCSEMPSLTGVITSKWSRAQRCGQFSVNNTCGRLWHVKVSLFTFTQGCIRYWRDYNWFINKNHKGRWQNLK